MSRSRAGESHKIVQIVTDEKGLGRMSAHPPNPVLTVSCADLVAHVDDRSGGNKPFGLLRLVLTVLIP